MNWADKSKWFRASGLIVILAISVAAADTGKSAPAENTESQRGVTSGKIESDSASKTHTFNWLSLADEPDKGAAPSAEGTNDDKRANLDEIGNKLNNPGANLASLNFRLNWTKFQGKLPGSSSQDSLTLNFQPVFPFTLPDGGTFLIRPSIPLVWQPYFNADKASFDEKFGLGDSQVVAFYSRTDMKKGYMWGLGATTQFPTHTDDVLGKDQFQMGPAVFAGLIGKWGSVGVFPQHWWNIGGAGEGHTSFTVVQPWYWFSVGKGWQVGGSPFLTYDWAVNDSDQALTVPVNLGVARTILVRKTPVKLKFEVIYYAEQPDAFGPEWGLQLTITPVVKNIFEGLFK